MSHFLQLCFVREGDILDIGANIGHTAVALAKFFPDRTIYAFEPEPTNVKILHKILRLFRCSNVVVYPVALGSKNGVAEFVLPIVETVRLQGMAHIVDPSISDFNDGQIIVVNIQTLDEALEEFSGNIAGIKIDVENYERFVIEGALQVLKRHMPIILCELWDNDNRTETIQLISAMNYDVKILSNNGQFQSFSPDKTKGGIDFFFIPNKNNEI